MGQFLAAGVLTLVTFLFSACGGNDKKEDKNFDQTMYLNFQKNTFSEGNPQDAVYTESKKGKDTIIIRNDGSVYIKVNFLNGLYRSSVPNKLYLTNEEYFADAVATATKKLTPSDSKKTWDDVTNEALSLANKELIKVNCSLDIYGINLTPAGELNVTKGNGLGQFGELFFDIADIRGLPSEQNDKGIPPSFHASVCSKENIKQVQDKVFEINKEKNSFSLLKSDFKFLSWFSFLDGDNFILSKRAKLTFNSMTNEEIKSSEVIFIRKNN